MTSGSPALDMAMAFLNVSSRPPLNSEAQQLMNALDRHPLYESHREEMAALAEQDARTWGSSFGPVTPRMGLITPHNLASDLFARFVNTGLAIGGKYTEMLSHLHGQGSIDDVLDVQLESVFEVLDGRRPVVFLTTGQQEALWHTEAEVDMSIESVFPAGPVVMLPNPIRFGAMQVRGFVSRPSRELRLHSTHEYDSPIIDILADIDTSVDGKRAGIVRIWVSNLELQTTAADAPTELERARLVGFFKACLAALELFGVTENAPTVVMSRAERRRTERSTAKTKPNWEHGQRAAIRYLRDPRNRVAAQHKTATGRHVKPHWRKGHIRFVRSGSMALPKEDRPVVRHLIPPVLVNAHLGAAHGVVVYRCQDPS